MKNLVIFFIFPLFTIISFSQESHFSEEEISIGKFSEGTLTLPKNTEKPALVIFIQGSGPTDRNGNQPMMKSDWTKKIARELAFEGIASYRFDKRIFKIQEFNIKEEDLRFEDFVNDVQEITTYFNAEKNYRKIILAGHSEGALISILADDKEINALVSLAGAGRSIDKIIVGQIAKQAPGLKENTRQAFDEIMEKGKTTNYNPALESIFRPSVQAFLASWIAYNPAKEIANIKKPILIIQGTNDIQVETSEAKLLHEAAPNSELVILEDMNHIFRKVKEKDPLINTKSYNEATRPLHKELVPKLAKFIKKL